MSTYPKVPKIETTTTLYSAFSIIAAYCIQALFLPDIQSDLRAVVSVSGFIASILFISLSLGKPENRIADASVKRHLRKNKKFLKFLVGAEILFRGWEIRNFSLVHEWRHQLSDRIEHPFVSFAAIPAKSSRAFIYISTLILLSITLFGQTLGFVIFDPLNKIGYLVFGVILSIGLYWIGSSLRFTLGRYIVEYSILREYILSIYHNDVNYSLDIMIEYNDSQTGIKKSDRINIESLKELIDKLDELVNQELWPRFAFVFERTEMLLLLTMEREIEKRGELDFRLIWAQGLIKWNLAKIKPILDRVLAAYRWWNTLVIEGREVKKDEVKNKDNLGIEEQKKPFDYQNLDDLKNYSKFFDYLNIETIGSEESVAASKVLIELLDNDDIRAPNIIQDILQQINAFSQSIIDKYVESFVRMIIKHPEYLGYTYSKTINRWKTEYNFSQETAELGIRRILEGKDLLNEVRRAMLSDIRNFSEPTYGNNNWNAYKRYHDIQMKQIKPLLEFLLDCLEHPGPSFLHQEVLDTLLVSAHSTLWISAGSRSIYYVIQRHKKKGNKLTETAILGILKSNSKQVLYEMVQSLIRTSGVGTRKIVWALVDYLFSDVVHLRRLVAKALSTMSSEIESGSFLHQKILLGLEDSDDSVRKYIVSLKKKIEAKK